MNQNTPGDTPEQAVRDLEWPKFPIPLLEDYQRNADRKYWYETNVGYADSAVVFFLKEGVLMQKSWYDNVPEEKADPTRFVLIKLPPVAMLAEPKGGESETFREEGK